MQLYQPTITGSLSVSGSINISGSINVVGGGGTITGTASYATNAELLDGLDSTVFTLTSSFAAQTASFTAFTASILSYTASQNILNGTYTLTSSFAAQTASFTAFTSSVNTFTASINSFSASVLSYTSSLNAKTSSFATTGSNTFEGIQTINSNLIVTGSITAQTLVVQTITSSVDFVTGSTRFGSISANTHVFTGSMAISGSGITINGTGSIIGSGTTNYLSKFTSAGVVSSSSTLSESGNFLTQAATGQTLYIINANTSGDSGFQMRLDGTLNAHLYTDRTNSKLTLGTLTALPFTIETNNTEKMRITSAGNVGIANSIPDTFVTSSGYGNLVVGNGAGSQGITIFGGTTGQSGLMFADASTGTGAYTGYVLYSHSSDKMEIATGGGTPRVTISSAGLVTKPYQTYFMAKGSTTLTSNGSTAQKLPYSTIDANIGSAYNGTTYTFTAPVTGVYQFNWQMFVPPSAYIFCHLYINDVASHSIEWNNAATANYHTLWGGIAKSLTANDTVYLALYFPIGYTVHLNGAQPGPGSFFSGYLLG